MTQIITAVYEQGRLRPLQKLNLHENQTVQLQLWPLSREAEAALKALVSAGLVRPTMPVESLPKVTEEQQQEVAKTFGATGPVSELIIQDRG